MISTKKWGISAICLLVAVFGVIAAAMIIVDPYFHFHAPLEGVSYPIDNQRYQNHGILENFEYDGIITGTSMTENFKSSEFDELFDANSVKVPFSGSYLKETTDQIENALKHNSNIKYVLRSLDFYAVYARKDVVSDYEYPEYLYDDKWFNDISYIFNKSITTESLKNVFEFTKQGKETTSFDEYSYWGDHFLYGKDEVLRRYEREDKSERPFDISNLDYVRENIEHNVIRLANEYPECEFYVFFPPYSIVYWDKWNQREFIEDGILIMESVTEKLLEYDNIHIFSFNTCFDMICDLNNYKDLEHYGDWINSQILVWMKESKYMLTESNYKEHFEKMRQFYLNYDYESIFEN